MRIGVGLLVAAILLGACASASQARRELEAIVDDQSEQGGQASPSMLGLGDCFDEPDGQLAVDGLGIVDEVVARPCDGEHEYEVFGEHDTGFLDYPGDDSLAGEAEEICRQHFERVVGVPVDRSPLDFSTMFPSELGWAGGDRQITCVASLFGEPLTSRITEIRTRPDPETIVEELQSACAAENWGACDLLSIVAIDGSADEAFGMSCGLRVGTGGDWCASQLGDGLPDTNRLETTCTSGDWLACDLATIYTRASDPVRATSSTCGHRVSDQMLCIFEFGIAPLGGVK